MLESDIQVVKGVKPPTCRASATELVAVGRLLR
jgi:hypothetical protein